MLAVGSLAGIPPAGAVDPPTIDMGALPPDSPPGPLQEMRQTAYCTGVGEIPGTDWRVQPKYMDMLNLPEAWKSSRGGGVTVAVIDTGVTPHPRLPNLVGGGDYVMAGGDGLSDCDAHGTLVASMIAAKPNTGEALPPVPRRPISVPTNEPPPQAPPPQTITLVPGPMHGPPGPPPPPPPPEGGEPPAGPNGFEFGDQPVPGRASGYSGAGQVVPIDHLPPREPPPEPPPPPPPPPPDAFTGIAPDAQLISVRQYSHAFAPKEPFGDSQDPQLREKVDNVHKLARAIVHAADMGARVINISGVVCLNARTMGDVDQADLGAAVQYAALDKDAVIVVAAGNTKDRDCKQNPIYNALTPDDPRDWNGVLTVVTPAWYDKFVLTVGAVDSGGAPLDKMSMAGPWVSIAAPGTDIEGLSARDDGLMNAVDGPENSLVPPSGTTFSAAIVSGVAALVRSKYPELTSAQVINRLVRTARPPARGIDNEVGYGIVDPVAALTWDVPTEPATSTSQPSAPLQVPPLPPDRDMTPVWVAGAGLLAALLAAGVAFGVAALRRSRQRQR